MVWEQGQQLVVTHGAHLVQGPIAWHSWGEQVKACIQNGKHLMASLYHTSRCQPKILQLVVKNTGHVILMLSCTLPYTHPSSTPE